MKYAEKLGDGKFDNKGTLAGMGLVAAATNPLGLAGAVVGGAYALGNIDGLNTKAQKAGAKDAIEDLIKRRKLDAKQKRSDEYAEVAESELAEQFVQDQKIFNDIREKRNTAIVEAIKKTATNPHNAKIKDLEEEITKGNKDKKDLDKYIEENINKTDITELLAAKKIETDALRNQKVKIAEAEQKKQQSLIDAVVNSGGIPPEALIAKFLAAKQNFEKIKTDYQDLEDGYSRAEGKMRVTADALSKAEDKLSKIGTRKEKEKEASKPKDKK